MEMMAMVSSVLAMQSASTQRNSTSLIKQNADAEKSTVQTLLGRPISPPASAAPSISRPKTPQLPVPSPP